MGTGFTHLIGRGAIVGSTTWVSILLTNRIGLPYKRIGVP